MLQMISVSSKTETFFFKRKNWIFLGKELLIYKDMVKFYSVYMFPYYPSGFASRNVKVLYWPVWSYAFVNRFCSPYQKGGGYTYSSPYGCAFLRIKVLFANLLAHFCNGVDAVLSRIWGMKIKVEWRTEEKESSKVFR